LGGSKPNPGRLPGALVGAGDGIESGAARKGGSRVSASRKTCRTCFPRCCLRSGFQTDPVTDDWYYSAQSAEPHHVHVGTDLCPSHGSPYCQYSRDTETRRPPPPMPAKRPAYQLRAGPSGSPAASVGCLLPYAAVGRVAKLDHGPVSTSPADVDVRPDWQYPNPPRNQTSTPRGDLAGPRSQPSTTSPN
jgi:hypothetical protein